MKDKLIIVALIIALVLTVACHLMLIGSIVWVLLTGAELWERIVCLVAWTVWVAWLTFFVQFIIAKWKEID